VEEEFKVRDRRKMDWHLRICEKKKALVLMMRGGVNTKQKQQSRLAFISVVSLTTSKVGRNAWGDGKLGGGRLKPIARGGRYSVERMQVFTD